MNYKVISYTLGWALNIEAACMVLPLICALVLGEPYVLTFGMCILICLIIGCPLVIRQPKNKGIFAKEGLVIVALSWIFISIIGALPFVFSGTVPNFIDALFETASGFTTTGASILTDVDIMPKSLLFWRSFTHWIGGMGVIVFLVAILPLSGSNNLHLIRAESPGPSVGKLVPKVKTTAKILYQIYISLTALEIVLLLLGGLDVFEALTLSFGTAGTGGFAIRNSGLAEYTPYVQNVITVFMIIFGVDFSFYYLLLIRKFRSAIKMEEVKTYFVIIICSILLIFFNIQSMYNSAADALKDSAFQVGSIITTTGYSTCDFNLWPSFAKTILVGLMFMGACAGSTGGGIKVSRIIIFFKSIVKEIKILVHPGTSVKVTLNGKAIEHETLRGINVFFAAYIAVFTVSLLIISLDNFDFTTNFTAVAATLSNIGPGLSKVGPAANFSIYSPVSKLVLTFAMIAGRLEIFPMLALFSKSAWKK